MSQSELKIRLMTSSDVDRVIAIERDSPTAPHWRRDEYLRIANGCHDTAVRYIGLVAELKGEVTGFAVARFLLALDEAEAEVESIVVDPGQRRNGIGSRLLEKLIKVAREVGAALIRLEVRESNEAAIRLYKRMGFTAAGLRKGYYSGTENAVLMNLEL